AQPFFRRTMEHAHFAGVPAAQFIRKPAGAVRRIVVHDQYVKAARLFPDQANDPFQVLDLVIGGDDDDRLHNLRLKSRLASWMRYPPSLYTSRYSDTSKLGHITLHRRRPGLRHLDLNSG